MAEIHPEALCYDPSSGVLPRNIQFGKTGTILSHYDPPLSNDTSCSSSS